MIAEDPMVMIFKSELDTFKTVARRVHAECGPCRHRFAERGFYWKCDSCKKEGDTKTAISHPPNCLWLAADAMKEAGVI